MGRGRLSRAGRRRCEVRAQPAAAEWGHRPALHGSCSRPLPRPAGISTCEVPQVLRLSSPPLAPLPACSPSPLAFPAGAQAPPAPGRQGGSLSWVGQDSGAPALSCLELFGLDCFRIHACLFPPHMPRVPLIQTVYFYLQLDL